MRPGRLLLLLTLVLSGYVSAQDIRGVVIDAESKKPLEGVALFLIAPDESMRIIASTFSTVEGKFRLKATPAHDVTREVKVSATLMGYRRVNLRIGDSLGDSLLIQMSPTTIHLREVKVRAPAVEESRDTVKYRVSAFTQKNDESLEDVLSRLPGIEVRSDGIRYEGKPINRFYIEDMDLLGRRYRIATNSLRPDDVASVLVYRDHEPIKLLRGRSTGEQAAINIKLTDKAKKRWLGRAKLCIGTSLHFTNTAKSPSGPFIQDYDVRAMRFGNQRQSIYLLRKDNTGRDLVSELRQQQYALSREVVFSPRALDDYAHFSSRAENLSRTGFGQRSRFNDDVTLSGNQIYRLSRDHYLRVNLHYAKAALENINDETTLLTQQDGSTRTFSRKGYFSNHSRKGTLEGEYLYNGSDTYLKNTILLEHQSKDTHEEVSMEHGVNGLNLSLPHSRLENLFDLKFLSGSLLWSIQNNTSYLSRDQSYRYTDSVYQSIQSRLLENRWLMSTSLHRGNFTFDLPFSWDYTKHDVDMTTVGNLTFVERSEGKTAHSHLHDFKVSPKLIITHDASRISLMLPVRIYLPSLDEEKSVLKSFTPEIYYTKEWNHRMKSSLFYSYYKKYIDLKDWLPGQIVKDPYRWYHANVRPKEGSHHRVYGTLTYNSISSGTSYYLVFNWHTVKKPYTDATDLRESCIISYRDYTAPSKGTTWGATFRVSQSLLNNSLGTYVTASYHSGYSDFHLGGKNIVLNPRNYSLVMHLSYELNDALTLEYNGDYQKQIPGFENRSGMPGYHASWSHVGKAGYQFNDRLSITAKMEIHRTIHPQPMTVAFADLSCHYYGKKVKCVLSLRNLANHRIYQKVTMLDTQSIIQAVHLRPIEACLTIKF